MALFFFLFYVFYFSFIYVIFVSSFVLAQPQTEEV